MVHIAFCVQNVYAAPSFNKSSSPRRPAGHPNFRPRFRYFSWHTAMLGAIVCLGLMFYLTWTYTLLALLTLSLIALYIARNLPAASVSARHSSTKPSSCVRSPSPILA